MKRLLLLLVVLAGLPVAVRADRAAETLSIVNYPQLHSVLQAQRTYCGVLVNVRQMSFSAGPKGLISGLTLGVVNGLAGTGIGNRRVLAYEYVVRMDVIDGGAAEVLTIYGGEPIEAGTPVFVTAGGTDAGNYWVRVIPSSTPEAYGQRGLEEARLERVRRGR